MAIRGSESSSSLQWKQLEGNTIGLPSGVDLSSIYFADLSGWDLRDIPPFIVELDQNGEIINRLFPAREPDWQIETRWKIHEFWWAATGGWTDAGCDPTTNPDPHCDKPWRSYTQLTDSRNDQDPLGIEPGNLTSRISHTIDADWTRNHSFLIRFSPKQKTFGIVMNAEGLSDDDRSIAGSINESDDIAPTSVTLTFSYKEASVDALYRIYEVKIDQLEEWSQ